MKSIDDIKASNRFNLETVAADGLLGTVQMPLWAGRVIFTTGAGWEHLSVSPYKKKVVPTWDDMCRLKDIFWRPDEAVLQIHPPAVEYVNNVENCLHLWRCTYRKTPLPPSVLVGQRPGQTPKQMHEEAKAAYAVADAWKEYRDARDMLNKFISMNGTGAVRWQDLMAALDVALKAIDEMLPPDMVDPLDPPACPDQDMLEDGHDLTLL